VGTVVQATQGAIVAFATQVSPNPTGTALSLGLPSLERRWTMARAVATQGAQTAIVVANPTSESQVVTVHVLLPSGWVAPWSQVVAPYSVWQQVTSPATRSTPPR
jgi:hypothetical protein